MTRAALIERIFSRQSFLCVGLDPEPSRLPVSLVGRPDPDAIFEFTKAIIDHTRDLCVAYKINTAFYEALGPAGWALLPRTLDYIGTDHFCIMDAKRGDIGNTSRLYARAFFEQMPADAVTVAPYMGRDSVQPFLEFEGKWAIVLALTSNVGSADFQGHLLQSTGQPLWENVLATVATWGTSDNTMFVVGATHPASFAAIRRIVPDHFLLVPGVGAQGGDLASICAQGLNESVGLLVNASRSILYASNGPDFAVAARAAAADLQHAMADVLRNRQ